MIRTLRWVALILVALGLVPGAAHALELPPRLNYDADLYFAVTRTLYLYYAIIGGAIQVLSILALAALCWLLRKNQAFGWTLAAWIAIVVSLALWALIVQPVNAQWAQILQTDPAAAPAAYLRLRPRWEAGHLIAFAAWLAGFLCLLRSILMQIPPRPTP